MSKQKLAIGQIVKDKITGLRYRLAAMSDSAPDGSFWAEEIDDAGNPITSTDGQPLGAGKRILEKDAICYTILADPNASKFALAEDEDGGTLYANGTPVQTGMFKITRILSAGKDTAILAAETAGTSDALKGRIDVLQYNAVKDEFRILYSNMTCEQVMAVDLFSDLIVLDRFDMLEKIDPETKLPVKYEALTGDYVVMFFNKKNDKLTIRKPSLYAGNAISVQKTAKSFYVTFVTDKTAATPGSLSNPVPVDTLEGSVRVFMMEYKRDTDLAFEVERLVIDGEFESASLTSCGWLVRTDKNIKILSDGGNDKYNIPEIVSATKGYPYLVQNDFDEATKEQTLTFAKLAKLDASPNLNVATDYCEYKTTTAVLKHTKDRGVIVLSCEVSIA